MKEIINNLFDNVVTLDLDLKYKNLILDNKKVLNVFELGGSGSGKTLSFFKKTLEVNKYFKYFKKKNISFFIGNVENILKYKKTLVKDILTTTNNKVYILSNNKSNLLSIEYIIKRYTLNYELKKIDRDYYLIIDCTNIKSSFLKNKIYYIKDLFSECFDFISNLLLK